MPYTTSTQCINLRTSHFYKNWPNKCVLEGVFSSFLFFTTGRRRARLLVSCFGGSIFYGAVSRGGGWGGKQGRRRFNSSHAKQRPRWAHNTKALPELLDSACVLTSTCSTALAAHCHSQFAPDLSQEPALLAVTVGQRVPLWKLCTLIATPTKN